MHFPASNNTLINEISDMYNITTSYNYIPYYNNSNYSGTTNNYYTSYNNMTYNYTSSTTPYYGYFNY